MEAARVVREAEKELHSEANSSKVRKEVVAANLSKVVVEPKKPKAQTGTFRPMFYVDYFRQFLGRERGNAPQQRRALRAAQAARTGPRVFGNVEPIPFNARAHNAYMEILEDVEPLPFDGPGFATGVHNPRLEPLERDSNAPARHTLITPGQPPGFAARAELMAQQNPRKRRKQ